MSFLINISNKKNGLTKNELKACERILEDLTKVQMLSLTKISEEINVSKTTILRFCQKLGYSGYSEFRYDCIRYVNTLNDIEEETSQENATIVSVENNYIDTISQLHKTIQDKEMERLAEKIREARIIRCIGEINSSVTCYQLRYALAMYGHNVDVVSSAPEVTAIDLTTDSNDLVLLVSATLNSESSLVNETLRLVENCGSTFAVVTMNHHSEILNSADISILLPNIVSTKGNSLLRNVPIFSIFVEILLNYLN